MSAPDGYDPTPDLEAQRPTAGARIALVIMTAVAVFELGSFLQCQMLVYTDLAWVKAWFFSKLALAVLALYAVVRASRLRDGTLALWSGVALAITLESGAWLVYSLMHTLFTCFTPLVVLASIVTIFAIVPLREACARAAEARERLASHDIDDAF